MKLYLILGNTKAGVFDRGGGKEYPTKGEKGEKNTVRKWLSYILLESKFPKLSNETSI